jgi:hypothetical protein
MFNDGIKYYIYNSNILKTNGRKKHDIHGIYWPAHAFHGILQGIHVSSMQSVDREPVMLSYIDAT